MGGPTAPAAAITAREREVWSLVAGHLTNREIADQLFLSVRTVESHVSSLIRKLGVADRRGLARHDLAPRDGRAETHGWQIRWPSPTSSFVGREAECGELRAAVETHRMVTATGPGGVGKTRLTLRVVEEYAATRRDGGWFVDLVHVTDPGMVVPAVAAAVGVAAPLGASLEDALAATLAASDAVLVLDNCEHVIGAVRSCVETLLSACAALSIVATSRVRMRAPFEHVYPVPGLSVDAGHGDAVRLFLERARGAGAGNTLDPGQVAALCGSLEGMALAIELAAARCPTLGLDGLVDALVDGPGEGGEGSGRGLGLLTAGPGTDERHQSLRGAIEWSYRLLAEDDRLLLSSMSVFASWFDVAAAVEIADSGVDRGRLADRLAGLADHSLLVVAPQQSVGAPTRYRALEAIRQYGAERLASLGHDAAVHARHRAWCHRILTELSGVTRDDAWCGRLDRLASDARAAVAWDATHSARAEAAGLAERLAEQLLLRGRPEECQRGYEQAARLTDSDAETARLLRIAAGAAASRLVGNDNLRLLEAAAAASVAAGDQAAAAEDLAWMSVFTSWAPGILAELPDPRESGDWLDRARVLAAGSPAAEATIRVAVAVGLLDHERGTAEEAERALFLARSASRPLVESVAYDVMCAVHLAHAELGSALQATARRGEILDRIPLDAASAYHFNDYLLMACEVHLAAGHLASAAEAADRLAALDCYREYPHPALARRVKVDAMAGHFEAAVERGERFLAAWERAGRPVSGTLTVSAYAMAMVHGLLGDDAGRARWVEVTNTLLPDPTVVGACATGWAPTFDALIALDRGDVDAALARMAVDLDDLEVWGRWLPGMWRSWYAALWAEAAVLAGARDAEDRLRLSALATHENAIAATVVRRAAALARGDGDAVVACAEVFDRLGCDYQRRRTLILAAAG